jgi:hypothetical protein
MTAAFQKFEPGDQISAGRMNDLVDFAAGQYRDTGTGASVSYFGSRFVNASMEIPYPPPRLVIAMEDFVVGITDHLVPDDVASARCRLVRLNTSNQHEPEQGGDFWVYDPVASMMQASFRKEGDVMLVHFNVDSGRWEVPGGQTEAGETISFAIISNDPTTRTALVEIRQRTFRGQTYGSFLEDTVVYVHDTDGCYLNEPNVDLTGRLGKAILMYVDQEAAEVHFPEDAFGSSCDTDYSSLVGCAPEKYWNVISLCCPSTICEV